MNFLNIRLNKSSVFKDEKGADEGGVLIEEEPSDQESNEPTDKVNNMASEVPEISHEDTKKSSPQTEEEPENPQANEESEKESPKKQVPKNIVTSWSDWVAKTTTSVNKETKENTATSASQPRVKRLAELPFCAKKQIKELIH